jgi:hypothetical protein
LEAPHHLNQVQAPTKSWQADVSHEKTPEYEESSQYSASKNWPNQVREKAKRNLKKVPMHIQKSWIAQRIPIFPEMNIYNSHYSAP